jgi:hypothetical protein
MPAIPKSRTAPPPGAIVNDVTAKEKLLELLPSLTEAQAERALHAVEQQAALAEHLDAEAELSLAELAAREDGWAAASARDAVREERW